MTFTKYCRLKTKGEYRRKGYDERKYIQHQLVRSQSPILMIQAEHQQDCGYKKLLHVSLESNAQKNYYINQFAFGVSSS